jgi:hypothetical protein
MRLWSIHPKYLDNVGLVACWREALLSKNVILGRTKGYKPHSAIKRFKESENPIETMQNYLLTIWEESHKRGYKFNRNKIYNE